MIRDAEASARALLEANLGVLDDLAAALVARETLEESELAGLLAGVREAPLTQRARARTKP